MAFFKNKKKGYIDLSEKLIKQEEKLEKFQNNNSESEAYEKPKEEISHGGFMGFFGGTTQKTEENIESSTEQRRKKLKSILNGLTDRIDEQEKEIYRLKQKLEVIERKQNVGYR